MRDGLQELQVEDVGRTELGIGEVFVYPAHMGVEVGTDVCHGAWHAVDGIEGTLHRLVHRHFVVCLRQCLLMQQHILAEGIAQLKVARALPYGDEGGENSPLRLPQGGEMLRTTCREGHSPLGELEGASPHSSLLYKLESMQIAFLFLIEPVVGGGEEGGEGIVAFAA